MSGIKALRKVQLFKEQTKGVPGPATTIWRGPAGTLEDTRAIKFIPEDVGVISGTDRTTTRKLSGALLMETVEATFEQLPHILEMGVKLVTTGAADGSGAGKIYTYTFPTTSANNFRTYTIETGDNQEVEEMEFCYVSDFTLTGGETEGWTMGANIIGRQVSLSSFTTAATLPTVEEIVFGKTKLYIDAIGGTFGTTLKSNTLLSAQLSYKSGYVPKFTADGNLYFSFVQTTMPEAVLNLTFEHDTTSTAEKVNWRAETARKIRLIATGSAFTAGSAYSAKTMIIDLNGKWETFKKIGERNGNDILEGTFRGAYDETSADYGKVVIVNTLTALP
jgi:hypothetical protein